MAKLCINVGISLECKDTNKKSSQLSNISRKGNVPHVSQTYCANIMLINCSTPIVRSVFNHH